MSIEKSIDLHMHSICSDGALSPCALVQKAAKEGITIMSLTDHDTVSGLEEAKNEADKLGIKLISGIEISAISSSGTLHILGYFIDPHNPALTEKLKKFRAARNSRNQVIIERLNGLGINITMEDVFEVAKGETVGRPHIARVLIEKKVVSNLQEAFDLYLSNNSKAYVDKEIFQPEEVIKMIHEAGGLAFIAHPASLKLSEENIKKFLLELKEMGLDGIEVYTPAHNRKIMRLFRDFSKESGLKISGGSDFHGVKNKNDRLGVCHEGIKIQNQWLSESFQV